MFGLSFTSDSSSGAGSARETGAAPLGSSLWAHTPVCHERPTDRNVCPTSKNMFARRLSSGAGVQAFVQVAGDGEHLLGFGVREVLLPLPHTRGVDWPFGIGIPHRQTGWKNLG